MAIDLQLEPFRQHIDDWTERLLRPCLERLEQRPEKSCRRGKEFNDAVWATVVLRPLEVVVLDSPLLQRLRHIRQLGVVHLVYPSATHTRFDHSIGTVHQVSRLIGAINAEKALISDELVALLRVTALCHDIGHGVMSHVSENALLNFRSTRRLLQEFRREIGRETRKSSEVAAYFMIGSPAFAELLGHAQRISGDYSLPANAAGLMQKALVGQKVADEVPLLHELISGPFDGDKLDYMTRDARMTGVPVVTDIPRLVQKVRGVNMATSELPAELKRSVPNEQQTCVVTGVALSGGRTLDELVFGKTLLFDKLYRHQKVRAAEAMVAAIFDQIADLSANGVLMAPFSLLDSDLMQLERATIERLAERELQGEDEGRRVEVAVDISRRLHERRLFRRAYSFAQNMPQDPYRSDDLHRNGLVILTRNARNPDMRAALVTEIADVAQTVLEHLGAVSVLEHLPGQNLRPYIWIDPPNAQTQSNETARAYLLSEGSAGPSVMPFRDEYAETPGWSNAYLLTRDTGYVFTIDELALPVYLATEKVARIKFGVRTPESMLPYAKHDPAEIRDAKRKLAARGFYDDAPHDIRPIPMEFEQADYPDRLQRVRNALEQYAGPVYEAQEKKRATVMSPERIASFVQQFGLEHADAALAAVERLQVIGRDRLVTAVKAFLAGRDGEFESVVPLGEAKDSSAVTTYNAGDIADLTIRSLGDALRRGDGVLFAEDFVGSGAQTISILEGLLDAEPTTRLNEEREAKLPPELQDLLRSCRLAIVFASGTNEGAEAVRVAARRLELDLDVHLHEALAPTADFGLPSPFKERCAEIGRQLLMDDNPEHDERWVEERVLGYGNHGFLVVFPYNTPTQTLTCLWKSGTVDGIEWVPLVPRRPKR